MSTSRDAFAEKYHNQVGETGDYFHKTFLNPHVLDFLGKISGKKILDLACGQGYFARILENKGAIVTGCDLSKKLIDFAKKHITKKASHITYNVCSADKLPYKSKSFDGIMCNMSVHDMENIPKVFSECGRVLKSGGIFIFSTLHPMKTMNERIQDKKGYGVMVRTYMTQAKKKRKECGNTRLFHRPLEYYLQTLFKNGFMLADFKEITAIGPDDKQIQKIKYKKEIPSFIICKAIKK